MEGWPGAAFVSSSRTVLLAVPSSGNEFRNTDQIVGDEIEQKVPGNAENTAMLGLAQRAVLFAPAEDALFHRAT
jgi:hypothetical protein